MAANTSKSTYGDAVKNSVDHVSIESTGNTGSNVSRNNGLKIVYNRDEEVANSIEFHEYVYAVADIIQGKNIVSAGRVAGGVVIFVKNTDYVAQLVSTGISINDYAHTIEPLV